MTKRTETIVQNEQMDKQILEYILLNSSDATNWWRSKLEGTMLDRYGMVKEWRLRMDARRSVAQLYNDVKTDPFLRSSNVGIGLENIFAEYLVPTFLANTFDLEPMLQAMDTRTEQISDAQTVFHDSYHRHILKSRALHEASMREMLTVGSSFHKWTWGNQWKQSDIEFTAYLHPLSGEPIMVPDPAGGLNILPADKTTPQDQIPTDPATGIPYKIGSVKAVETQLLKEGPQLSLRSIEMMEFPPYAQLPDPDTWDYCFDNFVVTPWWFLGKDGDPWEGKLKNLDKLWKALGIDPNQIYLKPSAKLTEPVKLKECHFKYPVTKSGKPIEITALIEQDHRLLLGWRPSNLSRRPYFNHQVRTRHEHPIGKGIPETIYGLRNALDAQVNQDIDAGNLYNHPPMLLSSLAMVDDEDYEEVGPGTQWIMSDIEGAKFMPPPISQRNPLEMINWIISMAQRDWGVTDLNLNAPTKEISPNVNTATGMMAVLNQGNIKFGHMTKKISEIHSAEFQLVHFMFSRMMVHPRTISFQEKPMQLTAEMRGAFFDPAIRIQAVGNGVTTNPLIRQKADQEYYMMMKDNPAVGGDQDVVVDLARRLASDFGIKIQIKDPPQLQMIHQLTALLGNPVGQQLIQQSVQQMMQFMQQQKGGGNGNGQASPVPMAQPQAA